ncbi:Crp/Fnr family transcriptional regulator [Streptomyces hiroshimensis]|uniref:Crp/Fnr family transcriptional regulator n=1 Tax=Streptomyces hiroshimensis TaxID=66424 RepID=A0ABQ2Y7I6_9ACTN|nr:Crp/Fnr family transcriptional regulator [Streptomyces hiroshimensis]GGX65508.1 Crp/Fnr family transcriptional regulator [Streptomyces hiroshimensis]
MGGQSHEERKRPARVLGVTFAELIGQATWAELLEEGHVRPHRAGEVLLRQGDPGTHALALIRGAVKVTRVERDGRVRVLAFRGTGDVVGEAAAAHSGAARLATVESVSACTVAVVEKDRFTKFVDGHGLWPALHEHAQIRLAESDTARSGYGGSCRRLAGALLALVAAVGETPSPTGLELAVTRAELAQYLGVSRNTVSSRLAEIGEGVVAGKRKSIVIHDIDGLRAVAADAGE